MGVKKRLLALFGGEDDEQEEEYFEEEYVPPRKMTNRNTNDDEKEKKVVSLFTSKKTEGNREKMPNNYVSIIRPKVFEDARIIANSIKENKVVTFSLEYLEFEVGQRVIDFVSGASYAMDATLTKVTEKVLTSIPNGVGFEDIDTSVGNNEKEKLL